MGSRTDPASTGSVDYRILHPWNVTPSRALEIQKNLRQQIQVTPVDPARVRLIAGSDISYNRFSDIAHAAFVVLDLKTLEIVARSTAVGRLSFPYVPGLLTFREAEPLLLAWKKLKVEPDVVVFDGQGIAHPRRLGIAAHMGLLIDRPSIGCGKSLLCGHYSELAPEAGSSSPLIDRGEVVGMALRTKNRVAPVFVSVGHKIDLAAATQLILKATGKYRIPEPTRQAHLLANEMRRNEAA